ncbi:hypothetical protein KC872_05100, partial [Candidatus Kaiserbacteria bacterium]|nr:hypothetical protein [Candidatus Kaiserbacteria bacterium]
QKTLVAFVVGLLIGGMLVWAFSGPTADAPNKSDDTKTEQTDKNTDDKPNANTDDKKETTKEDTKTTPVEPAQKLEVGDGKISVPDQEASMAIKLDSATYPVSEGWIGVREYNNEQLGYILGVVRFSESQGLVPAEIILQRATTPGRDYAVVIYTEDGDHSFNLANDVQIDKIFDTFKATSK